MFIFYFFQIIAKPLVIGIAGPSGSGKSTFAQKLYEIFKDKAIIISQDWYYKDLSHLTVAQKKKVNFDHPDAIDFDELGRDIQKLKSGSTISVHPYDFITQARSKKPKVIKPYDIIILEGILVLSQLKDVCDLKIYTDCPKDICIIRRIERDVTERGTSAVDTINMYKTNVRSMCITFVLPSKFYADYVVPSEDNNDTFLSPIEAKIKLLL